MFIDIYGTIYLFCLTYTPEHYMVLRTSVHDVVLASLQYKYKEYTKHAGESIVLNVHCICSIKVLSTKIW